MNICRFKGVVRTKLKNCVGQTGFKGFLLIISNQDRFEFSYSLYSTPLFKLHVSYVPHVPLIDLSLFIKNMPEIIIFLILLRLSNGAERQKHVKSLQYFNILRPTTGAKAKKNRRRNNA